MIEKKTILVVDDAEGIRTMVCAMLAQHGYDCLEAADGVDALKLLDKEILSVHLVLTDVLMPNMSGGELGRRLAPLRPDLPIVFMSGYYDGPGVAKFDRLPSIFLPKPFTAAALLDRVRQALTRPWNGLGDAASSIP